MNADLRKRHDGRVALVLAAVPLMCMISLLIINPSYIQEWFIGPQYLPISLSVMGLILLLTVVAYPALLGSLRVINSGRTVLGIVLVVLALTLLVFPAVLLVILTPAALQIMRSF